MPYPTLSQALGKDSGGRYFVGPNGRIPKGFTDPSNDDEATTYVVLVGPDGVTPIVTSAGIKIAAGQSIGISGGAAHDAPSTSNPLVMGGKAASGVPAAVSAGDAVQAFIDLLGQFAMVLRGSTGGQILPDTALLADNTTNPTLTKIQSFLMMYDGAAWDMLRGTSANGIAVDVTRKALTDLVASAPTSTSVGTASAAAVALNANRKGLVLINMSANTISFGLDGNAAVLNSGITLKVNQNWVMDEYTFTTGAIAAIASGAASTLAIQEFS
jgi:hypothetical protein